MSVQFSSVLKVPNGVKQHCKTIPSVLQSLAQMSPLSLKCNVKTLLLTSVTRSAVHAMTLTSAKVAMTNTARKPLWACLS